MEQENHVDRQVMEIKLLGQKLLLKSDADPEVATEVLRLVSQRLGEAGTRTKRDNQPLHVALLALLDLAEEYVRAKRRFEDYQKTIEAKSEELKQLLEIPRPS